MESIINADRRKQSRLAGVCASTFLCVTVNVVCCCPEMNEALFKRSNIS